MYYFSFSKRQKWKDAISVDLTANAPNADAVELQNKQHHLAVQLQLQRKQVAVVMIAHVARSLLVVDHRKLVEKDATAVIASVVRRLLVRQAKAGKYCYEICNKRLIQNS